MLELLSFNHGSNMGPEDRTPGSQAESKHPSGVSYFSGPSLASQYTEVPPLPGSPYWRCGHAHSGSAPPRAVSLGAGLAGPKGRSLKARVLPFTVRLVALAYAGFFGGSNGGVNRTRSGRCRCSCERLLAGAGLAWPVVLAWCAQPVLHIRAPRAHGWPPPKHRDANPQKLPI